MTAPSIEGARRMGATGGPAVEAERLAFEAWMAGHCWALSATWTGTEYLSDGEQGGWPDPRAMMTRRLWAAWRDRAALAAPAVPVAWHCPRDPDSATAFFWRRPMNGLCPNCVNPLVPVVLAAAPTAQPSESNPQR